MNNAQPHLDLQASVDLALQTLKQQNCAGAVAMGRREEWSADVRLGSVETVESAVTRSLRVTAYGPGNRSATCSTSDVDPASVRATAAKAAELSNYADPDEWAGLPPSAECGLAGGDLQLDDPAYAQLDRDRFVATVVEAEKTALSSDPRCTNSHRSSGSASRYQSIYATTAGTNVRASGTRFAFHIVVIAQEKNGERQMGYWRTSSRHLGQLKSAKEVGSEAGRRAVRGFGWKKIKSGPTKVVLHNEVASEILGITAGAASGGAVYRGSSFLASQLGKTIASPVVTIVDDPLIPRELGSRPCDSEGVRSRMTTVIDQGRLASFLVGGYSARRLKHPYTGHEGGTSNLRLVPGKQTFDDLLREMGTGLLVTEFHGFGVDLASGTISKGISGFWVENGKIGHPVQEVTVAGNLKDLLPGIRAVGNDPLQESSVSSPSLLVDGFTVGGI